MNDSRNAVEIKVEFVRQEEKKRRRSSICIHAFNMEIGGTSVVIGYLLRLPAYRRTDKQRTDVGRQTPKSIHIRQQS